MKSTIRVKKYGALPLLGFTSQESQIQNVIEGGKVVLNTAMENGARMFVTVVKSHKGNVYAVRIRQIGYLDADFVGVAMKDRTL